jgi:uncharacterized protein (DUF2225 family)
MSNEQKGVVKRLYTLLKNENLVKEYLKQYGYNINAKNINEIKYGGKGGKSAPLPKPAPAAHPVAAKPAAPPVPEQMDPVFETTVNCPVCEQQKIRCYELRAKSQQIIQTVFLVPIYAGTKDYFQVDSTRLAVTVCPQCLFASPDKKNFNYPSVVGDGEEKSTLAIGVIANMRNNVEERKALLPAAVNNPDYFKRERSVEVAIESYRLAMARANEEAAIMQPYGYFKLGSYALKIAYMLKVNGKDDTAVLTDALKFVEKSFSRSECTNEELEMQVLYLNVALNIRLGDLTKANSYLNAFAKLLTDRAEQMKRNPSLTTQWIQKWQDKAKYLWEERENPEYFTGLK